MRLRENHERSNGRYHGVRAPISVRQDAAALARADQHVLAAKMQLAAEREPGSWGKFDAARKVFREHETVLLNRVARGSARAHSELDQLRKSNLNFAPTYMEGVPVDYGPRGQRRLPYFSRTGDFPLLPDGPEARMNQPLREDPWTHVLVRRVMRRDQAIGTLHSTTQG